MTLRVISKIHCGPFSLLGRIWAEQTQCLSCLPQGCGMMVFESHSSGRNWTLFNQQVVFLHLKKLPNWHLQGEKLKKSTNHRMHVNILQCWKGERGLQPSFSLTGLVACTNILFYRVNGSVGKTKTKMLTCKEQS